MRIKILLVFAASLCGVMAALWVGQGAGQEAARLLEDRSMPWWSGHRPPEAKGPIVYAMAPVDKFGSQKDPPIRTPVMPLEAAAHLAGGKSVREGHPLRDREFILLDVRRRSEFLAEHIEGSVNVPARDLQESLQSGTLSALDRRAVIAAYGSRHAHFEVIARIRNAGFDAVYALEGGLEGWKSKDLPLRVDAKLVEFWEVLKSERPAPPQAALRGPKPIAGLEPRALKTLMDAGLDFMTVFVGDDRTFEAGHIPGSIHVPLAELEKHFESVERSRLIVLYCGCCTSKQGGPSEMAVKLLRAKGFSSVLHLDGHMNAWKEAGLPVAFPK
ncbi:MAG: rhodanese-like domain-containing protein [Planctomycetes bacterium]|nr:rhodanese-like domain-containing protein [Planctomycetota bacterium]